MNNQDGSREYGWRYRRTESISDLLTLAERIIADLAASVGIDVIPAGVEFSLQVRSGNRLFLRLGGLGDSFVFASPVADRYSDQANALIDRVSRIVESYNWRNPNNSGDHRFLCSIILVADADFHSSRWSPGVIRRIP